ncbi:hypothetical protein EC100833_1103, partial [Escherichia coli 10.0833]
ETGTLNHGFMT